MGVFNSKEVRRQHTKRDDASDAIPLCPSGASWYNENCADPNQESHGCFFFDPCGGHIVSSSSTHAATSTSGAPLKNTMSALNQDGCFTSESFYSTSCGLPGDFWYGCFSPDPCINATSAAAASAAATTTQTTPEISSARAKITTSTTSTSSDNLHTSSDLPASASQTSAKSTSASARTASPVAVASSAPAKISLSPSPSHPGTAAVAAGTVGAIIGAITALILMLLVLRWRKRRREEKVRTNKHENGLRVQGIDVNGAGSSLQDKDGSDLAAAYRDVDHNFPLYHGTSNAGNDGDAAYKLSDTHSAVPQLSPVQPGLKMAGPTPDPSRREHELEVPASHSPMELSPSIERFLINIPHQNPNPSRVTSSGQSILEQMADGPVMHPNLDLMGEEVRGHSAQKTGGSHIMSWMSYDGEGSGPER